MQVHLHAFINLLDAYDAIPVTEKKLFEKGATSVSDPGKRRELKIAQYKKEKELKTKIEVLFNYSAGIAILLTMTYSKYALRRGLGHQTHLIR